MSLRPNEFEDYELLKYVCFEDGVVLFTDACSINTSHQQLVLEREGIKAISAGKIKTRVKKWQYVEGGSSTAKLSRLPTDEGMIDAVLKPFGFSENDGEYWY